jgi:hypothetical protein
MYWMVIISGMDIIKIWAFHRKTGRRISAGSEKVPNFLPMRV